MVFNGAQFHLLLNHLPVIGFLGATLALIVAVSVQSIDLRRFVLGLTVLVGLTSLPSYWTGEPAEEVIEDRSGVDKTLIHEHEEAAEFAVVLAMVTSIAALGALFFQFRRPDSLKVTLPIVLALSLITAVAMGKTAHDGGKIRHPEIRADEEGH